MNYIIVLLILLIFFVTLSNICMFYFIKKPTGDKGKRGLQGPKGQTGKKGPIGNRGPSGINGLSGKKGPSYGLIGIKGDIGDAGPRGLQGDIGFEGLRGETGDVGIQGFQGAIGEKGKTGIIGQPGNPRIFIDIDEKTNNKTYNDIKLMAFKDKCVTIKNIGNTEPLKFKCPTNMAVFNIEGSKIDINSEDMKIENITCCKFGIPNFLLQTKYNLTEVNKDLLVSLGELVVEKDNFDTKLKDNIDFLLTFILPSLNQGIPKEFIYPLRLLHQLRTEKEKFLEEIRKFPKNNIIELEKYLKIE